jgi:methionyl-tRNA formyltransferase
MNICIAGKNSCAINALKFLINLKFDLKKICVLPNNDDKSKDGWQPSLKKFALKKKLKIIKLKHLYLKKDLFFFSIEFDKIINVRKFLSKNLYNIHFSLLPKFRGCHTNFYQINKGEKYSGVTLHEIDKGIDTGNIIDQIKFKININDTAHDNYKKLMFYSTKIFKKNLKKILKKKYNSKKQRLSLGSYYSRKSVNYKKISQINIKSHTLKKHNIIRSLIFPAYQLPTVNGNKVIKSIYRNKKFYLINSIGYKT